MLYLAVTGKTLILFNCQPLGDGTQYLVAAPGAKCFQGDHLASLVLSVLPMFLYTVGWPLAIGCIFYVGGQKKLLDNPKYVATFGFL